MIIYNEEFGEYFIKVCGVSHYKVFRKKKCIKIEKYSDKSLDVETLTDDDYNFYEQRVASKNSLMESVWFIFEQKVIFKNGINRTPFYSILKSLDEFTRL